MGTWSIELKTFPELNLEVMRRRLESPYRVWLIARHIDRRGSSRVTTKQIRSFVARHGLWTRKTLYRVLKRPSPFWERYGNILKLRGVLTVAADFDVQLVSRPVLLPAAAFASMHDTRVAFVASYFAERSRTISIATLADLTGRCPRSLIRYLDSPHVVKEANFMRSAREPGSSLDPELAGQGYFRANIHGHIELVKRMPNTYQSTLETAPRGITRKQRRRTSLSSATAPPTGESALPSPSGSAVEAPGGSPRRRYFRKPGAANRALQCASPLEPVYLEAQHSPDRPRGQFWEGYTVLERMGPPVRL